MGYTTSFMGKFDLDKQLSLDDFNYLKHLGEDYEPEKIEGPHPDFYCQWVPTEDGRGVKWNDGEKFYDYVEWLQWLIDTVLKPRGYALSGSVAYQGEETGDCGTIRVLDGRVAKEEYKPEDDSIAELVKKGLKESEDDEERALFYLEIIAKKMGISHD